MCALKGRHRCLSTLLCCVLRTCDPRRPLTDKPRLVEGGPAGGSNDALPVAVRVGFVEVLVDSENVLAVVVGHDVAALGADLAHVALIVVNMGAGMAHTPAGLDVALAEAGDNVRFVAAVVVSLAVLVGV